MTRFGQSTYAEDTDARCRLILNCAPFSFRRAKIQPGVEIALSKAFARAKAPSNFKKWNDLFLKGIVVLPTIFSSSNRPRRIPGFLTGVGLLVSNAIAAWLAIREGWGTEELMSLYWAQGVIIGVFSFLRILACRRFNPPESRNAIDGAINPTAYTRNYQFATAFVFLFTYGLFHLGYGVVLADEYSQRSFLAGPLLLAVGIFFLHHLITFREQTVHDHKGHCDIGDAFGFPFPRVFPMHLTMFLAAPFPSDTYRLGIFVVLKTAADVAMHFVEAVKADKTGKESPFPTERGEDAPGILPAPAAGSFSHPDRPVPALPYSASVGWRIFAGILVVGSGILFCVFSVPSLRKLIETSSIRWVEVPCVIGNIETIASGGKHGPWNRVTFSYTYQGREYTSNRLNAWRSRWKATYGIVIKRPSPYRFAIGEQTSCHVNPRIPQLAVIQKGLPAFVALGILVVSILPLIFLAGGILMLLSYRWSRNSAPEAAVAMEAGNSEKHGAGRGASIAADSSKRKQHRRKKWK